MLSVLFSIYDCPFGILKLFLNTISETDIILGELPKIQMYMYIGYFSTTVIYMYMYSIQFKYVIE